MQHLEWTALRQARAGRSGEDATAVDVPSHPLETSDGPYPPGARVTGPISVTDFESQIEKPSGASLA